MNKTISSFCKILFHAPSSPVSADTAVKIQNWWQQAEKKLGDKLVHEMPKGTVIQDQDGNVLDWDIVDGVVEVKTPRYEWKPIGKVRLEFCEQYWLKTVDGLVINEVATYDGTSFTNGRWFIALSLVSDVIKLNKPK